ncbi:MAG: tandem-95 repeat protein, partial [Pseudomonadota bacterium]
FFSDGSSQSFQIAGFEVFDITGTDGGDSVRVSQGRTLNFQGLEGNDVVNAVGSTSAVAYFLGNESDFAISVSEDGNITTVTDLNLADGDEGTDTLIGVTDLVFGTRLNPNDPPQTNGDTSQEFTDLDAIPLSDLFDLSDPEGLGDIVSLEILDDTPGTDGGLFLSMPPFGAPFTVPRPASGPYRLDITPAELEFWSYQPGTYGTNAIQIEATDSEGNVSDPLVINLTFTDPNPAPVEVSFADASLEVNEGENFTFRLNFSEALPTALTGNFVVSFDTAETTDITQSTGQFIVPAGQDFGLFTIGTFQDLDFDNEQITVSLAGLSGVGGIQVIGGTAIGTIIDDDAPPLEAPVIADPGPIVVSAGATGVLRDLVATDDEDSEGAGLFFSNVPAPDQLNFGVNPNTGEITFNRGADGSLPEDANGDGIHELTVKVTNSDGLSDTVDLQVQVIPENKNADAAILEYLAKEVVYGRDLVSGLVDPANAELLSRLGGLNGADIEYTFEDESGTFFALAISKPGYNPILVFRGTQPNIADWSENFRATGVGLVELNRGLDTTGVAGLAAGDEAAPTLREWLFQQENLSITGHSQGGAQAQLAAWVKAKEAVDSGNTIDIAQVMTFNSAGMTLTQTVIDSLPTLFAEIPVNHSINAGDVVSLTGNSFLPGTLDYHDNIAGINPAVAHTEYWVNDELRALSTIRATPIVELAGGPDWAAFTSDDFSPVTGDFGQDTEYQALLNGITLLGETVGRLIDRTADELRVGTVTIESSLLTTPMFSFDAKDFEFRDFIVNALVPALSSRGRLADELAGENGELVRELIAFLSVYSEEVSKGAQITVEGSLFGVIPVSFEVLSGTAGEELHSMGPGESVVLSGRPEDLFGDRATDFREEDTLVIADTAVTPAMFDWYLSSAVLTFDLDLDGEVDGEVVLEGDYFEGAEFNLEIIGNDTHITVDLNQAPVASGDAGSEFETDESTAFTTGSVLSNDSDEDGDALSVSALDTTGTLGLVTDNGDGTFDYDPNGAFDGLAEDETTTDTFVYFVSDGVETVQGEVTITVTGVNDAPVVSAIVTGFGEDETSRAIDLLNPAFVNDPNGDSLGVANVTVATADDRVITATTDLTTGLFSLDNGQFEDLASGDLLDITVTYDVTDGIASVANTATLTITGANDGPVAGDDAGIGFTTGEDTAFTTDSVLSNDSDVDGDTLTVSGLDTTGTLGLVTDNGDGTFDYDPNGAFETLGAGESAADSFSYTVSDGNGGTDTATIKVTVNGEDEPVVGLNETVDIDFEAAGFWGRTVADITTTDADGNSQSGTQALNWFSRKITLDDADIKITSGGPGFDTVSAINGGLGVSSRADGFSFRDRLDTDRRESLKFSLREDDDVATRLLLDFADQEGDVRLVFFNDGERVSRDTYSYEDGMLELTDLAFDKVRISGAGRDDVRVTGIEFDRIEESDLLINGVDSFDFV